MRPIIALCFLVLSGCINVPVVEQAANEKPMQGIDISCSKPYALTQDCTSWMGFRRTVSIDGFDVLVAASEDGATVVIFDAHSTRNIFLSNPFVLNSPRHSRASNTSYEVVREVIQRSGFKIVRAIPLKTFADTSGYILELDGNGYEVLKTFTVRLR